MTTSILPQQIPVRFSPKMARNCVYSMVKTNRLEVLMKGESGVGIKSLQLRMMENKWVEDVKAEEQATVSDF